MKDNPRYPYKPNIPLTILVNPVLEPLGDETLRQLRGLPQRAQPARRGQPHVEVRVRAWDRHGQPDSTASSDGLTAGTYQHEVDHLHGKLFVDCVSDPTTLSTWTEFERHHQAAFVDRVRALVARVRPKPASTRKTVVPRLGALSTGERSTRRPGFGAGLEGDVVGYILSRAERGGRARSAPRSRLR